VLSAPIGGIDVARVTARTKTKVEAKEAKVLLKLLSARYRLNAAHSLIRLIAVVLVDGLIDRDRSPRWRICTELLSWRET
jgi:hypothetical protein